MSVVTATQARLRVAGQDSKTSSSKPTSKETQSETDKFFWTYTEEPHRSRRYAIIKAHPEVLKLCGPEPKTKYLVTAVVLVQLFCAYALRNQRMFSWPFLLIAYVVGATANQNLFLAIHEISHNLAFKSGAWNRIFAIFANIPIGIPYSAGFRPYHLTHHKSLGVDGLDTDLPTAFEAIFLDSVLGKTFFCTFQILFYAVRPIFVYKMPFTNVHFANIVAQVAFDLVVVQLMGRNALAYFIMSSFLAGSLHPCASHFIAEHYVFSIPQSKGTPHPKDVPIPETYSYYGPLNVLTYNVGYHNEHHDFPAVPWSRLPQLYSIAKEFYEPLPCHKSWPLVTWQFILDKEVGLWCRVKRAQGGRLVGSWTESEVQS
jgi:sphingolipid delta-4 desaturase